MNEIKNFTVPGLTVEQTEILKEIIKIEWEIDFSDGEFEENWEDYFQDNFHDCCEEYDRGMRYVYSSYKIEDEDHCFAMCASQEKEGNFIGDFEFEDEIEYIDKRGKRLLEEQLSTNKRAESVDKWYNLFYEDGVKTTEELFEILKLYKFPEKHG
jgi:hypothetical protein